MAEDSPDGGNATRLVAVGTFNNDFEASMAQELLGSAGIDAFLSDQHMGSRIGIGVHLLVPSEDAEAATEILASVPEELQDTEGEEQADG